MFVRLVTVRGGQAWACLVCQVPGSWVPLSTWALCPRPLLGAPGRAGGRAAVDTPLSRVRQETCSGAPGLADVEAELRLPSRRRAECGLSVAFPLFFTQEGNKRLADARALSASHTDLAHCGLAGAELHKPSPPGPCPHCLQGGRLPPLPGGDPHPRRLVPTVTWSAVLVPELREHDCQTGQAGQGAARTAAAAPQTRCCSRTRPFRTTPR